MRAANFDRAYESQLNLKIISYLLGAAGALSGLLFGQGRLTLSLSLLPVAMMGVLALKEGMELGVEQSFAEQQNPLHAYSRFNPIGFWPTVLKSAVLSSIAAITASWVYVVGEKLLFKASAEGAGLNTPLFGYGPMETWECALFALAHVVNTYCAGILIAEPTKQACLRYEQEVIIQGNPPAEFGGL